MAESAAHDQRRPLTQHVRGLHRVAGPVEHDRVGHVAPQQRQTPFIPLRAREGRAVELNNVDLDLLDRKLVEQSREKRVAVRPLPKCGVNEVYPEYPDRLLQQQAVGILGVNLIYAAFRQRSNSDAFLAGLFDQLSIEKIEIDVIQLDGPAFAGSEGDEWCLALLGRNMAHAIMFDRSGNAVEPSHVLRKRPALVMRGTFGHAELLDPALFESAKRQLV